MRKHRMAAGACALVLIVAAQGAAPLHAAEPWSPAQPTSPLALARHFQSLTGGGPFDPARVSLAEPGTPGSDAAADASPSAIPADRDLW